MQTWALKQAFTFPENTIKDLGDCIMDVKRIVTSPHVPAAAEGRML